METLSETADVEQDDGGLAYRWECPMCGQFGYTYHEEQAIHNVQAHLRGANGVDHGSRNEYPDGITPEDLEAQRPVRHLQRI